MFRKLHVYQVPIEHKLHHLPKTHAVQTIPILCIELLLDFPQLFVDLRPVGLGQSYHFFNHILEYFINADVPLFVGVHFVEHYV